MANLHFRRFTAMVGKLNTENVVALAIDAKQELSRVSNMESSDFTRRAKRVCKMQLGICNYILKSRPAPQYEPKCSNCGTPVWSCKCLSNFINY